ncbi:glycosyltransferase family 39 protein, partial [Escherichia coli]|uniref:glycosyltransferase family 39 protein n=1 Tax=Escherichia coli TaxID=562 RepID=UPI003D818EDF
MCFFGSAGLLSPFAIIRRFLPFGLTAFSVGLLALGPIYGTTAVSYMSDVPSFAVQAFALWAGVRALESPRRPLIWVGVSLG